MSKPKVKKPYSLSKYTTDFILETAIILYIILMIGNAFVILFGDIWARYIPMAIVGFFLTRGIMKSAAKRLKKSEKENFKKNSIIFPIIIAVVMLLYGLYSVNSNINSLRKSYNMYSMMFDEDESGESFDEKFEEAIAEAKVSASLHWLATSASYLAFAELGVFLVSKKLDELMQEDEVQILEEDKKDEVQSKDTNEDEKLDLTPDNKGNEAINNINWNL